MTLADLILESGGVNPEFKSFRVDITRLDEDGLAPLPLQNIFQMILQFLIKKIISFLCQKIK